jgi:hypothetical protein
MVELYLGTFDNFKFTIPRDGDFFSVSREFKLNNEFEVFKSSGIMNVKFSIVKLDGATNISIDRIYFSNLIPMSNDGSTICWISSLVDPFCLTKDFIARLKLGGISTISPSSLNKDNILLPNAYRFTLSNNIFSHNDILNNIRGSYILRLRFNADNTISVLPVIHTISRNRRTKDIEVQNWGLSYYKDDISGNDDTYLGNKYLAYLHDIIISNLDLEPIDKAKLKTSIISNINYK